MLEKLTARQSEILDVIKASIKETGFPPTRAEIAEAFGFKSANAAEDHLRALERKGYITILPGSSRGIQVTGFNEETGIPLVGRVAAGQPMLAEEYIEDRINLEPEFFNPAADYFLKVRGMSMRDAGILEDDLLAVHITDRVRKDQIVVARLTDEVTVKRYEKKGNIVYLHPENPDFETIVVDTKKEPLTIEGIAVGIIRNGGLL
ncbi:MAG: transcriptional repressor LexA [Gammaproteobacteria bacterium]|nr:transcriptional repressor LexA [Gammaproteobacteria bacterium]